MDDDRPREPVKAGFRHDINALRAVAVLAVLLFHFKVPGFEGGFAGVDIFFVVSGYLMTTIINDRLDRDSFSVFGFYADRARRIIPPLVVVAAAVLTFGVIKIDPLTLSTLGGHVFSSLTFWSNQDYLQTAGYFDGSSEAKWLLHTWSLSVEWQFYLIFPLLFMPLVWLPKLRRFALPVLLVGMAASMAVNMFLLQVRPTYAFYILPSRAWEMLLGGVVALVGTRLNLAPQTRTLMQLTGFAAILLSVFTTSRFAPWPSPLTLLPTLGTALVIAANAAHLSWTRLAPVKYLGRWSYSIYLWHWPLVVALTYYGMVFSAPVVGMAVVAVIVMGAISYTTFEQAPQRWFKTGRAPMRYATLLGSAAIVAALGLVTHKASGWEDRHGNAEVYSLLFASVTDRSFPNGSCGVIRSSGEVRPCQIGDATKGGVAVLGDSHAEQIYARGLLHDLGTKQRIVFLTQGGCPPVPGVALLARTDCSDKLDNLLAAVTAGDFERIVITANWPVYFPPVEEAGNTATTICMSSASGCVQPTRDTYVQVVTEAFDALLARLRPLAETSEIVFMLDPPTPGFDVPTAMAKMAFDPANFADFPIDLARAKVEADRRFVDGQIERVAAALGGTVVDATSPVCSDETCPTHDGERPLYWDSSHLTTTSVQSDAYSFLDEVLLMDGTTP